MMQTLSRWWGKGKAAKAAAPEGENTEPSVEPTDWDAPQADTVQAESPDLAETEEPRAAVTPAKTTDILSYLFIFFVLIILIPATIVSTFEISNRMDFVALLDKEIAKHKTDLVELDKSPPKTDTTQKARPALLSEISTLERFRESAHVIMANGAIPLEGDLFSFRDLVILKAKSVPGSSVLSSILHGESAINKSKYLENSPVLAGIRGMYLFIDNFNDVFFGFVGNYGSNSLLAFSLVLSSMIGALVCYFRSDVEPPFLLRGMISGLVMGFIVYLIIKGGRDLFATGQANDLQFSLNLYGACLLALLAGSLADRVFRLFKALVGLLGKRS
ncbi:MAG: hypothetical protein HQL87_00410 [Magnetococcales bacterium]|nr:hypothetical protein [Magnetococcales bacterium]